MNDSSLFGFDPTQQALRQMMCDEMISLAQTDTHRVSTGLTKSFGEIIISFAKSSFLYLNNEQSSRPNIPKNKTDTRDEMAVIH
jgi:hypothetical protein